MCLRRPAELIAALDRLRPSLLLLDLNFGPGRTDSSQGLRLLDEIHAARPQPPVVVVLTAYGDIELAVQALKRGAFDFIVKPWDNVRLVATCREALQRAHSAPSEQIAPAPASAAARAAAGATACRTGTCCRDGRAWPRPRAISARPRARWVSPAQRCIAAWKSMASEKVRLFLAARSVAGRGRRGGIGRLIGTFLGRRRPAVARWHRRRVAAGEDSRGRSPRVTEPPPTHDARRLAMLQAQLEHLPVAAWLKTDQRALQPLSSRARRLAAPGGVRELETLNQLLRASERSGPVVLDTERGTERWQLQRQTLAIRRPGADAARVDAARTRNWSPSRCGRGSSCCRC